MLHGYPSEDIQTCMKAVELVFLAKWVSQLDKQLRLVRLYIEDSAARYFDTLSYPGSWEEWKRHWIGKYTLWGYDVEFRWRFYAVKQETEDPDNYIAEFLHRLSLISDPGEKEVFHAFLEGLNKKLQQHLYREVVLTL